MCTFSSQTDSVNPYYPNNKVRYEILRDLQSYPYTDMTASQLINILLAYPKFSWKFRSLPNMHIHHILHFKCGFHIITHCLLSPEPSDSYYWWLEIATVGPSNQQINAFCSILCCRTSRMFVQPLIVKRRAYL